eukprot:GHVP01019023.1.p1 GENE.GHVP01019023.1~~GHVP01019023.1.p1  ORF type:complete len:1096 (-),score=156.61 GHVP01019023.1:117-3404(-)
MECPCFLCTGLDPVLALSIVTSAVAIQSFDFQKYACGLLEIPWRDTSGECNRSDLRWFELLTKCYVNCDSESAPNVPQSMNSTSSNHLSFLYSSDASDCDVFGMPLGYALPARQSLPPLPALILRFAYETGLFHPSLIGIPSSTSVPETNFKHFKRQQSLSEISTDPTDTDQSRTPPTPLIHPYMESGRSLHGDCYVHSEQETTNTHSPYRNLPFQPSSVVLSESAFANRTAFSVKLPSLINIMEHHRSKCIFFSKRDIAAFSCPGVPSTLVRMISSSSSWLELYKTTKSHLRQPESNIRSECLDITYLEFETAKHLRNSATHEFAKLHFQKINGKLIEANDYNANKIFDRVVSKIVAHDKSPKGPLAPKTLLPCQAPLPTQPPAIETPVFKVPIQATKKLEVNDVRKIKEREAKEPQQSAATNAPLSKTSEGEKTGNKPSKSGKKNKNKISKQLQGKLLSIPLPPATTRVYPTKSNPKIAPLHIVPQNLLQNQSHHLLSHPTQYPYPQYSPHQPQYPQQVSNHLVSYPSQYQLQHFPQAHQHPQQISNHLLSNPPQYDLQHSPQHQPQHPPQHQSQHQAQHQSQHQSQHPPQHQSQHPPQHQPQHQSQHPPQHQPQHQSQHQSQHPPQHQSQHPPQLQPQHQAQYQSQQAPQISSQNIPTHPLSMYLVNIVSPGKETAKRLSPLAKEFSIDCGQVPNTQQQVKNVMSCSQDRSYTSNYLRDPHTFSSRSATTSNISSCVSYPQYWKIQYPCFNAESIANQFRSPVVLVPNNPSPPKYKTYPSNESGIEIKTASRRSIEAIQEAIDATSFKPQQQTFDESSICFKEFSCKRKPCYWPSCTGPTDCPAAKECTSLQFEDICSQATSKHLPSCAQCRPARVPPHIWYPFFQSSQLPPYAHLHTPWGEESCRDYCDTGNSPGKSACQRVVLVFGFLMDFLATTRHVNRMELVNPSRFHGVTVPKASVLQYCQHLQCSGQLQPETFVIAYIYVNRILEKHINIVNSLTVHRFVVGLLVVAAKFFEEVFLTNKAFSKYCGIQAQELNQLEELVLKMLQWNLYVNEEEYEESRRFLSNVGVMEYLITGSFLADHALKIANY